MNLAIPAYTFEMLLPRAARIERIDDAFNGASIDGWCSIGCHRIARDQTWNYLPLAFVMFAKLNGRSIAIGTSLMARIV